MLSWQTPWAALLAAAGLLVLALWRRRHNPAAWVWRTLAEDSGSLPRTLRQRWAPAQRSCWWLGMALLSIALGRPLLDRFEPQSDRSGRALAVVLDVSSSMLIKDRGERDHRFEQAQQVLKEFIDARREDRVALITFARQPHLRCPLTSDATLVQQLLEDLHTVPARSGRDGTALGAALAEAAQILAAAVEQQRVVVLLTDGQNNQEEVLPYEGAWLCAEAGIRVHCVALGEAARPRTSTVGFDVLEEVAQATGGALWSATAGTQLRQIYAQIDRLERAGERPEKPVQAELFTGLVALGTLLLGIWLVLELTGWQRL